MADHDVVPTHVTEVVRTERLSRAFVRVTFGGGLERFASVGLDDFVYVLLSPPGRRELPVDASFRWSDYYALAEHERPVGAYYTARGARAEQGEVDCDVFLHEPPGTVSGWAPRASVDDAAALWGPRTAWHPPPTTTDWLLVTDETDLPAVAAISDARPADVPVRVFVEMDRCDAEEVLRTGDGVEVTWLHRRAGEAGQTTLLADAVRAAGTIKPTTYAWGGAESRAMAEVRRHLRREAGLAREQVSMTPYWRHARHAEDAIHADD